MRNADIGSSPPKIIVPLVEKNTETLLQKAENLQKMHHVDVVEWRTDFFETDKIIELLPGLRDALKDKSLLFTFRTKNEGGEKEISQKSYHDLNIAAAKSGMVDLLDVEIFSSVAKKIIAVAHESNVIVVGSRHDFSRTPPKDELISWLKMAQEINADIPKIAVMPTNTNDVLTLLAATSEMYESYADRPIITMSMGHLGVISRISGEIFGSCMTFGTVGEASAPGQIPLEDLAKALEIVNSGRH